MGNNWEYGFVVIEDEGDFLEQMRSTYRKTVEHFDLLPPHELHGVYEAGTDVIVCHTGLSPNSRENAETIVALKAERDRLARELEETKAELARMRPVVERILEWRKRMNPETVRRMLDAMDAYRAGAGKDGE